MEDAVRNALADVGSVKDMKVNSVSTPRWDPRIHASEDIEMQVQSLVVGSRTSPGSARA